ncbi:hypothetical protein [Asanoa iriomotensis]|uniref:Uncharacterized protein n=1 Tax=Asanoa iriomotensis TaxID=234613 RepID=A0ABQ4C4L2_9ACTN|nr:hypothetical protein [Asanoa iriomotensis]GIF57220.1 hypothetical protein Air01nite_33150 [Asanoa iriomotensis]
MTPLERRYRRLLLAYPRAYRRARGDELLTTLLEGAPPDRTHPPAGEAWDLVRGGLRQRFGPPHGRRYTVLALLGAAAAAYVALGVAVQFAADRDPGDVALPAAVSLMPPDVMSAGRASRTWTSIGGPTQVDVTYAPGSRPVPDLVADLRSHALAEGWAAVAATGSGITLERGGQTMVVTVGSGPTEFGVSAFLDVRYPVPAALLPAGAAALLLGGLTGWLVTTWTLRRFRALEPTGRLAIALTGVPALLLIAAAAVGWVANSRGSTQTTIFSAGLPERLGLLCTAATLGLAAVLPTRRFAPGRTPVDPVRVGARVVAVAHLAFGVAMATVLVTFTTRMLTAGADRAAMLSGAHDPKEVLSLPVFVPVALLYYTGLLLSPLLLTASVPLLVTGRRRVGRVAWHLLLVAAVSAVVLPALMLTPYGGDAARWWLD